MIYIAADHAGYELKEELKKYLDENKIKYEDLGAKVLDPKDDYPDFAKKIAQKVQKGEKGILICGTGMGICMAANRFKGVRATLVYDNFTAKISRQHNDSNIICLGGRTSKPKAAKRWLGIWLKSNFNDAARHKRRIKKLDER